MNADEKWSVRASLIRLIEDAKQRGFLELAILLGDSAYCLGEEVLTERRLINDKAYSELPHHGH